MTAKGKKSLSSIIPQEIFHIQSNSQPAGLTPKALLPLKGTQKFPQYRPTERGNGYHTSYKGSRAHTVEETKPQ